MRSLLTLTLLTLCTAPAGAAGAADAYRDKVVPFLKEYCARCHDARKKSGELDLTRFPTAAHVLEDFRQWEHVVAFLKKEEMPPKKARQPSAALRAEMVATLEKVLLAEARKLAGDPGVVPPRRLSNAEYDYSVQDLTGVDIRPAKSFPVDPASGEGFNNTGEALVMTPSLFKKYYAAAEDVADHALMTTRGLRFAPYPVVTFADRQKYYEQKILNFYEKHAVDYEKTFAALLAYKHRPALREAASVEQWAREATISPKYARLLWDALEGKSDDRFLIRWLRSRWKDLPAPPADARGKARALASEIQRLSRALCVPETQAIVANAGNGPIEHLARRRKTAEGRDQFDGRSLQAQQATVEYRGLSADGTVKLVIRLADVGDVKAEGVVVVKAGPAQGKRGAGSLRALLEAHAPAEAEKLKFGKNPFGDERVGPDSFVMKAPGTLEIEVPAKAFPAPRKGKLNVTLKVEFSTLRSKPGIAWPRASDGRREGEGLARPLVGAGHPLAARYEASAAAFCRLFPNRFYYVDGTRGLSAGFHLIEGFFRDDRPLCRSVLSDAEKAELGRLWAELYFVTGIWEKMLRGFVFFERSERNFLKHRDFDSFKEEDPELVKDETLARFKEVYLRRSNVKLRGEAIKDHPINVFFEEVRGGLRWQEKARKEMGPRYLQDVLAFAERAWRRPLTAAERKKIEALYLATARDKNHGPEAAVRAALVRVLASPHFLMRFTPPAEGDTVARLPDLELASRLSYFIWAGPPDEELLALAKAGKLQDEATLRRQVRRMVRDEKVSRFAREFFGQWLGYRDFLSQKAVNRAVFRTFDDALELAMFEEPTRFAAHLIRDDRPITELISSDATFVNKRLARHYDLKFDGDDWGLVTGMRAKGRGGLLGMAVVLTRNSQPQRTSPVKRGFWVVHKLLGEHIPPPPPDVAVLPAKETETKGKTIRQLLKSHVEDAKCARCHQRFDPVGLAMEGFDPIGRARTRDLAGRPIDNAVTLPDGKEARGVPAFAEYLARHRTREFTRTMNRKFLGYALGRSLQLSDQPLLEKMQAELEKGEYKLSRLFEAVATSPQFRDQRCKEFSVSKFRARSVPGGKK